MRRGVVFGEVGHTFGSVRLNFPEVGFECAEGAPSSQPSLRLSEPA